MCADFCRTERDLELVGVTAIEDKLQEGVPQAIGQLITAGIKVRCATQAARLAEALGARCLHEQRAGLFLQSGWTGCCLLQPVSPARRQDPVIAAASLIEVRVAG